MTDGSQIVPLIPADPTKSKRRSVFLVKFTDASRSNLDYLLKNVSFKSSTPVVIGSVEIGENEGSINFGDKSSSGSKSEYRFSISDMHTELAKGQLESTRQCGDSNPVESLGQITQRLKILASDKETFESTKQKALQEIEEAKKQSEKISSVKVKTSVPSSLSNKSVHQKWQKLKTPSVQRPLTPMTNAGAVPKSTAGGKTVTPPGGSSSSSSSAAAAAVGKFGELSKKSLRQRIIQHLALHPSRPANLLARLTKEGLLDEDKSSFDSFLNDVAQPKPQSNGEMELRPSSWSDVRTDWPHYTKYDTEVVKKTVAAKKLIQSNSTSTTTAAKSTTDLNMFKKDEAMGKSRVVPPPPTNSSSMTSTTNVTTSNYSSPLDSLIPDPEHGRHKRSGKRRNDDSLSSSGGGNKALSKNGGADSSSLHPPPAKEAALESGKSVVVNSEITVSAGLENSKKSLDSSKSVKGLVVNGRSSNGLPASSSSYVAAENNNLVQSQNNLQQSQNNNELSTKLSSPSSPPPPGNNNNNSSSLLNNNDESSINNVVHASSEEINDNNVDYLKLFPPIRNADERRKYKDLFDQDYNQYMDAYNKLHDVALEFEKLGEKLDKLIDKKQSSEYKSIEKEIYIKYKKFVQDPVMIRCKSEHERLRSKLAVLKERVKEFDES